MTRSRRQACHGLALPVVLFLMVILGTVLAGATTIAMRASQGGELEVQGARALAAARAGTEWGAWMVADPEATRAPGPVELPSCPPATTLALPQPLDAFTVEVSCTRHPATGSVDEGGLKLASYRIVAVSTAGADGDPRRVQRRVEARLTICKNPGGLGPRHEC